MNVDKGPIKSTNLLPTRIPIPMQKREMGEAIESSLLIKNGLLVTL